ncbi:MAG: hypothetical protein QGH42_13665 [Kiritimatiellia bacterium]|jgi:hypothetical protein|nr:hypothetical protein [Kiritimatiellia bacterium]MDP6811171.1 hypothetical protein [Kiritimatiellia bacterium]MDP7025272.1 hypothetical protein [Kiritimatiellia bacterium]
MLVLLVALIGALSCSWLGSIMHESDQASFIDGAWQLAQGSAPLHDPGFYEYDKYFLSYWALAGVYAILPACDPILTANLFGFVVYWVGLLFLTGFTKGASPLRQCLLLGAALSPSLLLHLPYFSPNLLSAGMLFLGGGLVRLPRGGTLTAALFWALAAGCRADVLLLLPLLVWIAARQPTISGLLTTWRTWAIVGATGAVHVYGKYASCASLGIGYTPFLVPRVYLAYLVFGLGSGAVVLILLLGMLFRQGWRHRAWQRRVFWWWGAVALSIPFIFYSVYMFSPRHWIVLLAGMIALTASPQWNALAADLSRCRTRWMSALLLVALLPLVVGIRLPSATSPHLTLQNPTLFPTADGRAPMGAVLPFMWSPHRLDHSHRTWLAAREIGQWEELEGAVPIGASPLYSIVALSVRLDGQTPKRIEKWSGIPFLYVSTRTLIKKPYNLDGRLTRSIGFDSSVHQPVIAGGRFPVGVVKLITSQFPQSSITLVARWIETLARLFNGNEVVWLGELAQGTIKEAPHWQGRSLAFLSEQHFTITHSAVEYSAEYVGDVAGQGMYAVRIGGDRPRESSFVLSAPVCAATSTYPDYMQIQRLE